jgi:adenosylcobyric acid synthase
MLLQCKGLDDMAARIVDINEYKNKQYDVLADVLRHSLDIDLVYKILNGGSI